MAQIKIGDVIDHLSYEMKRALEDAVSSEVAGARFDRDDLFRAFTRAVYRKCSMWENVPDHLVNLWPSGASSINLQQGSAIIWMSEVGPSSACPVSGGEVGKAAIRASHWLGQLPPTFRSFKLSF